MGIFQQRFEAELHCTELIEVFEKLLDQFDTEVGIPSVGSDKKERLNVLETRKNDAESVTRLTTWLETMQTGVEMTNRLYPEMNLSIKIRSYETAEVKPYGTL